jgi:hypothetical protein
VAADELLAIPRGGRLCVSVNAPEYRIGRPRVYRQDDGYVMYYTKGTISGGYFPGKAFSSDGVDWRRHDDEFELKLSGEGWDSVHLCYPALLRWQNVEYMFYNGNNMGIDGFGVAVRELD